MHSLRFVSNILCTFHSLAHRDSILQRASDIKGVSRSLRVGYFSYGFYTCTSIFLFIFSKVKRFVCARVHSSKKPSLSICSNGYRVAICLFDYELYERRITSVISNNSILINYQFTSVIDMNRIENINNSFL